MQFSSYEKLEETVKIKKENGLVISILYKEKLYDLKKNSFVIYKENNEKKLAEILG